MRGDGERLRRESSSSVFSSSVVLFPECTVVSMDEDVDGDDKRGSAGLFLDHVVYMSRTATVADDDDGGNDN